MTGTNAVFYRARCEDCKLSSRQFRSYSNAEIAAKKHTAEEGHVAYVTDQYSLRITGSTVRPGEPGPLT